jgi:competence protein ComFA
VNAFICPRCTNQDPEKIGLRNGLFYCRACIQFQQAPWQPKPRQPLAVSIQLGYALTPEQQLISNDLIDCYRQGKSAMVDAVTGSGKTEIVFALIQIALAEGKRVGFVIPRKDVIRELIPRFKQVFPSLEIVGVFGGHSEILEGDIIILTTHQMYRYERYFDVLIFDEVDAFPYAGNPLLKAMVQRSLNGMIVYLSATFTESDLVQFRQEGGNVFQLFKRFHGQPMPNLQVKIHPFFLKWFTIIDEIKTMMKFSKPIFVFVPTIRIGHLLYRWLCIFFKQVQFAYSSIEGRETIVDDFKKNANGILVTTSILERGITMVGLQVIIFMADHSLFLTSTIIQMAGRVGRKKIDPSGIVMLLANKMTEAMKTAKEKISFANAHL